MESPKSSTKSFSFFTFSFSFSFSFFILIMVCMHEASHCHMRVCAGARGELCRAATDAERCQGPTSGTSRRPHRRAGMDDASPSACRTSSRRPRQSAVPAPRTRTRGRGAGAGRAVTHGAGRARLGLTGRRGQSGRGGSGRRAVELSSGLPRGRWAAVGLRPPTAPVAAHARAPNSPASGPG